MFVIMLLWLEVGGPYCHHVEVGSLVIMLL